MSISKATKRGFRDGHWLMWLGLGLLLGEIPSSVSMEVEGEHTRIFSLASGETGARELSGITYAGENRYYVVSDAVAEVYPLTIELSPENGTIRSARLGRAIALDRGRDLEGVAHHPGRKSLLIADEAGRKGPGIYELSLDTDIVVNDITVPSVYRNSRPNRGLESLALSTGGSSLWTANEEALSGDGPLASPEDGSLVRFQRFDEKFVPAEQYVYKTDPVPGESPFTHLERSGVVDLAVLPDGRLLVLERALGGFIPAFRHRIYVTDPREAPDVTSQDRLTEGQWEAMPKKLLWESDRSALHNFEGMTIGPPLQEGGYALILISDNGGQGDHTLEQALWPLRLSGITEADRDTNGASIRIDAD